MFWSFFFVCRADFFFSIELDSVCACVYELVSHVFHDISFSFSYSHRIHEFGRCVCLGSIIGPFPACVLCVCLMVIFLPPSFTPRERFSTDEKRIFLKFQKFACILISYMLPFNDTHTRVIVTSHTWSPNFIPWNLINPKRTDALDIFLFWLDASQSDWLNIKKKRKKFFLDSSRILSSAKLRLIDNHDDDVDDNDDDIHEANI